MKTSWTARSSRTFVMTKARAKAASYADRETKRGTDEWTRAFNSYLAGWIAANRQRFAELRVKLNAKFP